MKFSARFKLYKECKQRNSYLNENGKIYKVLGKRQKTYIILIKQNLFYKKMNKLIVIALLVLTVSVYAKTIGQKQVRQHKLHKRYLVVFNKLKLLQIS